MAFEASHALTDGANVMPHLRSALFRCLARMFGLSLDRTGLRLLKGEPLGRPDGVVHHRAGQTMARSQADDALWEMRRRGRQKVTRERPAQVPPGREAGRHRGRGQGTQACPPGNRRVVRTAKTGEVA